jgi:hypothetical protein
LLCKEKHSDLRFFFIGLQLAKGIIFGIDPLEDREEQKVAKGGWLSNLVPTSPFNLVGSALTFESVAVGSQPIMI